MIFQIHRTHRHTEGAGLHNEYYESDEPCDDYIDHEVEDSEVYAEVEKLVIRNYFNGIVEPETRTAFQSAVHTLLSDLDLHYNLVKLFYDELKEKYEQEYNNEQKEIKELEQVIFKSYGSVICESCGSFENCKTSGKPDCVICKELAEALVNAGYGNVRQALTVFATSLILSGHRTIIGAPLVISANQIDEILKEFLK